MLTPTKPRPIQTVLNPDLSLVKLHNEYALHRADKNKLQIFRPLVSKPAVISLGKLLNDDTQAGYAHS